MRYRNFDIELYEYKQQRERESFTVRVSNSPAGDQSPSQAKRMTLPRELHQAARRIFDYEAQLDDVIEYGQALADCLLPPSVRQILWESLRLLQEEEALRLRLKFDAWQLADLAWEYVYIARSNAKGISKGIDGFWALDRRISIVRYEYTDYPLVPFQPGEDAPLRQLVLLSSPLDFPLLDLEDEWKSIGESLRSITNLTIEFLHNPTVEMVQEALDRPTHIFHFAGHGGFQTEVGEEPGSEEAKGFILLCGSEGEGVSFPADKLALNLVRCGVRIAFLNTSESAARDSSHRLSGLAPALVHAGIPAVIGLSSWMTDQPSITFSRAFYRTLAAGHPLDTAVTNGRLAIFNQTESGALWGSPVLYLRTDDSTIFPIRPRPQKAAARRLATPGTPALRDMLVKRFNVDELKLLCADITEALNRDGIQQRVDLDIVGGNNLETYALNLIQHMERRDLLDYLIDAATARRPNRPQTGKDQAAGDKNP